MHKKSFGRTEHPDFICQHFVIAYNTGVSLFSTRIQKLNPRLFLLQHNKGMRIDRKRRKWGTIYC